jgi:hypothetical protein
MPMGRMLAIPAPRPRRSRWFDAAGPRGLAACTGHRERAMNAEVSHEVAPHL